MSKHNSNYYYIIITFAIQTYSWLQFSCIEIYSLGDKDSCGATLKPTLFDTV